MFKAFVSTCAFAFRKTHRQNKIRRFDTEGFVLVSSLCGVVGSSSWFTKGLIGRTGNILSVAYINTRYLLFRKPVIALLLNVQLFVMFSMSLQLGHSFLDVLVPLMQVVPHVHKDLPETTRR